MKILIALAATVALALIWYRLRHKRKPPGPRVAFLTALGRLEVTPSLMTQEELEAVAARMRQDGLSCWESYERIYGSTIHPPYLHVVITRASKLPEGRTVCAWHYGTPLLELAIRESAGYSETHFFCGELHNIFRWKAGLPTAPVEDDDRERFARADSVWRDIP